MSTEDKSNQEERLLNVAENDDGSAVIDGFADEPVVAAPETKPEAVPAHPADDDDDDDAPVARTEDDAELQAAPTEVDRQKIRERRKLERQEKRQRAKDREQRFHRELQARDQVIDEMRAQLETVMRRTSGGEVAQLDARLQQETANMTYLKSVIADGTKVGNGEAVAEASVKMAETLRNIDQLNHVRNTLKRRASEPAQPQVDPRMVANAQNWMSEHKWYNPASGDPDSRMVLAIDSQLTQEGHNPTTPAYWQELTERVKKFIPHRSAPSRQQLTDTPDSDPSYNGASQGKPGRSVVAGSGRSSGNAGSNSSTSYTLSPERVTALKDAGMWDDPKARNDAIKRYRDYDKTQSETKSSARS